MLKEELDKEVEEYIKNIPFVYETDLVKKIVRMYCEDAIKYGIELGKSHIWHDLRKNPDDLPPMIEDERMISEPVWIHVENWGSEIGHFDYRKNVWIVRCRVVNLNVLAWVDIPNYADEAVKLEKGLEQENSELKEKLAIERSTKGDELEKKAIKFCTCNLCAYCEAKEDCEEKCEEFEGMVNGYILAYKYYNNVNKQSNS